MLNMCHTALKHLALPLLLICFTLQQQSIAEPVLNAASGSKASGGHRFIVHGDLTGGERPGIFATAAEQIRLLQPDFVISVGDLIEGDGDSADGLHAQWEDYEERAGRTGAPVYLVGGNHDLTSTLQREVWAQRYGPTYYHVRRGDLLLLVLDTEDYGDARREQIHAAREEALTIIATQGRAAAANTEYMAMPERVYGAIGEAQLRYFKGVLSDNADARWTFLFMHKAPWEGGNSANFHALEKQLAGRPYTVFHGHEHAYRSERRRGADYIRLATTGGVQLPDNGRSADHVMLVSVSSDGVEMASLDLAGIRNRRGELPARGGELCFESTNCPGE
jgi:predicted phosphodiesterase